MRRFLDGQSRHGTALAATESRLSSAPLSSLASARPHHIQCFALVHRVIETRLMRMNRSLPVSSSLESEGQHAPHSPALLGAHRPDLSELFPRQTLAHTPAQGHDSASTPTNSPCSSSTRRDPSRTHQLRRASGQEPTRATDPPRGGGWSPAAGGART
ncbi:hypothetical protein ACCO45_007733 [Purpureocillium lilacinum]|uniref:Uncharacterized protein n=1 Tax=Purpureocillium lilacinum TaxID=33203 RepID=A0ACC4DPB1_PURLI